MLLHLGSRQLLDVGGFVNLQLGGHGVEAPQQLPQLPSHRQGQAGFEVAAGNRAHALQELFDRPGNGEGVKHRPQDHQHPDGDEHRHGHFPGEGRAGEQGFVGVDAQGEHTEIVAVTHHRHKHIGHPAIRAEVLADEGGVGALLDIGREFQAPTQEQFAAAGIAADGNAQVDDPFGIGEKDVAQAPAGAPKAVGNGG